MNIKYKPDEIHKLPKFLQDLRRRLQSYTVREDNTSVRIEHAGGVALFEKPIEDSDNLPKMALSSIKNLRDSIAASVEHWRNNQTVAAWARRGTMSDGCAVSVELLPSDGQTFPDVWEVDLTAAYIAAAQKLQLIAGERGKLAQLEKLQANLQKIGLPADRAARICKKVRLIAVGSLAKTVNVTRYEYNGAFWSETAYKDRPADNDFQPAAAPACEPTTYGTQAERAGDSPEQAARRQTAHIVAATLFSTTQPHIQQLARCCKKCGAFSTRRTSSACLAANGAGLSLLLSVDVKKYIQPLKSVPSDAFFACSNKVSADMQNIEHTTGAGVLVRWVDAFFVRTEKEADDILTAANALGYDAKKTRHKAVERVGGVVVVHLVDSGVKVERAEHGALIVNDKKTFHISGARDKTLVQRLASQIARFSSEQVADAVAKHKNVGEAYIRRALRKFGIEATEYAEMKTREGFAALLATPALLHEAIESLPAVETVTIATQGITPRELAAVNKRNISAALLDAFYTHYYADGMPPRWDMLDADELIKFGREAAHWDAQRDKFDEVGARVANKILDNFGGVHVDTVYTLKDE